MEFSVQRTLAKKIAIPGAADLVTTLARLIDLGNVKNVKIDVLGLHTDHLIGDLFIPGKPTSVPFKDNVHKDDPLDV
jgi:hypothetical protein